MKRKREQKISDELFFYYNRSQAELKSMCKDLYYIENKVIYIKQFYVLLACIAGTKDINHKISQN